VSAWREAVLERIEPLTPRISSFFLRIGLPAQRAGQHLDVQLSAPDGYTAQRSYSIASRPGAPLVELAIERLDDGEVSSFFHEVAQPGDTLDVRGPLGGHFVWSAADGGPLLLIAGGSGIAPLIAIARERCATDASTKCLLIYSARHWADLAYRDELLGHAEHDANFEVLFVTTREPRRRTSDLERRLDTGLLGELLRAFGEAPRHSYVCGSTPFVETVTSALVQLGVPAHDIRAERYGGP
jgi:ferredoxin-NADP reductase